MVEAEDSANGETPSDRDAWIVLGPLIAIAMVATGVLAAPLVGALAGGSIGTAFGAFMVVMGLIAGWAGLLIGAGEPKDT